MQQGLTHRPHDESPSVRERVRQLLPLDRASSARRALAGVGAMVLAILWGVAMLKVQQHFAALRDAGESLSGGATLLANGSSAAMSAAGWMAAMFFSVSVIRLRRGAPEPPMLRGTAEHRSVATLRHGLRAEFRVVRAALLTIIATASLDSGRLIVLIADAMLNHAATHRATLAMVLIESAGLWVAAVVLGLWADGFRRQLQQLGAL